MKKISSIITLLLLFGFIESNKIVFKSADGKTKITATKEWKAAGNMKGVEIYISKVINENIPDATLVVSKDTNLPAGTDLSTYSAGKLFLQTSVSFESFAILVVRFPRNKITTLYLNCFKVGFKAHLVDIWIRADMLHDQ